MQPRDGRSARAGKDLIVWADCEDDAKGLDRALSGDAYTAFRVRRVSYGRNIPPGPPPEGPLIFGPLVRNLGSPDQQNSQVTAPHHRLRPNRVLSQVSPGEELTTDYALFDDYDGMMQCRCGTPSCRATIGGQDWQRPDLQRKYGNYFSSYLLHRLARQPDRPG